MQHPTESALDTLLGAGLELCLTHNYDPPAGDFWSVEVRLYRLPDGTIEALITDEFAVAEWSGIGSTPSDALWNAFGAGTRPAEFSEVIDRLKRFLERQFIKACPADANWRGEFRRPAFRKAILASADDECRPELGDDPHFPAARRLELVG